MNILIVANHYAVCSARYAADAFTRLRHTVCHVGQPMGRNIWGMQVPEQYVWEPDDTSVNPMRHQDCDACIVMDSDPNILDALVEMAIDFKPPLICWGVDNHVRDYRREYFDHYFLAHKSVSVMPWEKHPSEFVSGKDAHGSDFTGLRVFPKLDMTWLPCAYDSVAFPPSPIPWAERAYDVCMIGVMYPKRWQLVNAMRAAGLKVLAGTGLVYEAYKEAHWNSRVALVSSFNGDLPIRLFEGAGMGCVVMHDDIADLQLLGHDNLADGTGIYRMESVESAIEAIQKLSSEAAFASGLAAGNVQWAQQHTWDKRAQVILDWLEARS